MRTRSILVLLAVSACRPPGAGAPVGVSVPRSAQSTTAAAAPRETPEERAARLHRESIIVDTHNDIPSVLFSTNGDFAKPSVKTHTDLARLKASGLTAVFFSVYVDRDYYEKPTQLGGGAARHALDLVDITYRTVERHPQDLVLATSAADIRKAKRDGKVAILMGIEGGHAIENSLAALRDFHRLGCRYMTLTHSNTNDWADSAGFMGPPVVKHHGLSPFGEEVVREMQRIGMLVDVSHTSDETFAAVMKIAKAPVIASHSSSRALTDHRRNLTDDMLRALAKNGGVAMVNFWSTLIDAKYFEAMRRFMQKHGPEVEELRAKYKDDPAAFRDALERLKAEDPLPKTPLTALVDHIDHMIEVAGADHVGLGTDFDGVDAVPVELEAGVQSLPKLTLELVRRGHTDETIRKVLGGNFLRVLEAAEAHAQSTRTTVSGGGSLKRIDK